MQSFNGVEKIVAPQKLQFIQQRLLNRFQFNESKQRRKKTQIEAFGENSISGSVLCKCYFFHFILHTWPSNLIIKKQQYKSPMSKSKYFTIVLLRMLLQPLHSKCILIYAKLTNAFNLLFLSLSSHNHAYCSPRTK